MFGLPLGIVIETLVAILLATTIGYCVILNQRLKRLHSDRGELKHTAQEAETVLETRLGEAERFGVELAQHVNAGQQIMDRLARITSAARGTQPFDDRLDEPNKVQSALQQLSMRPRIRGNAA